MRGGTRGHERIHDRQGRWPPHRRGLGRHPGCGQNAGVDARAVRGAHHQRWPARAGLRAPLQGNVPRPGLRITGSLHRPDREQAVRHQEHQRAVLHRDRRHAGAGRRRDPGHQLLPGRKPRLLQGRRTSSRPVDQEALRDRRGELAHAPGRPGDLLRQSARPPASARRRHRPPLARALPTARPGSAPAAARPRGAVRPVRASGAGRRPGRPRSRPARAPSRQPRAPGPSARPPPRAGQAVSAGPSPGEPNPVSGSPSRPPNRQGSTSNPNGNGGFRWIPV